MLFRSNDTATTEIYTGWYTLSLHDALPISPECQFRVQWGGSGAFVAKNSDATSWHELVHKFGPFCTEFYKAPKWSKMHPNSTNRQFRVQWGGSSVFVVKNSDATSWHELLH